MKIIFQRFRSIDDSNNDGQSIGLIYIKNILNILYFEHQLYQ